MREPRYTPRPSYELACVPFISAEEAWFWFIRCLRARRDGARFLDGPDGAVRPCEPDDLYRAVMWLFRRRRIGEEHLKVLEYFGLREAPPDPRCREEEISARLWDMALDRLTTVLKGKGIVVCEEKPSAAKTRPTNAKTVS